MARGQFLKGFITLTFMALGMQDGTFAAAPEQFISLKKIESSVETGEYSLKTNIQLPGNGLEGWKIFEQTVGSEKVILQFPDKPAFTRVNDSWGASVAVDGKTEYWLMAPIPALGGTTKEDLFPIFIEKYSSKPYQNAVTYVLEEDGNPVLDIEAYNKKSKKMEHIRLIITKNNFYVASIKYKKSRKITDQPSLFLESIYVLK